MGTMGETTSQWVQNLSTLKVEAQIESPRFSDPIMRRPSVDRGEKQVIHGSDHDIEDAA